MVNFALVALNKINIRPQEMKITEHNNTETDNTTMNITKPWH